MPSLADHKSQSYRKLLLLGDAKVGKTSSLISLVAVGFKLRILDMDNLIDPLAEQIKLHCPDKLASVEVVSIRDKWKMTDAGPVLDGVPKAFSTAVKMIDRWKYDDVDLGVPGNWGPDCIFVLDSLSRFCDAAYNWAEIMTPKGKSGEKHGQAIYGTAQDGVENTLSTLTSAIFETNLIVICHGVYMALEDGTTKIFPQGIGQKLSPKIPQYFPYYVRYINTGGKRTIQLKSNSMINLATPLGLPDTLPMETGLATIFKDLQPTKPTKLTRKV